MVMYLAGLKMSRIVPFLLCIAALILVGHPAVGISVVALPRAVRLIRPGPGVRLHRINPFDPNSTVAYRRSKRRSAMRRYWGSSTAGA